MSDHQLKVDWPECKGRGLCHELAPELIELDPWGFPIIRRAVSEDLLAPARDAVSACPRQALHLRKT